VPLLFAAGLSGIEPDNKQPAAFGHQSIPLIEVCLSCS
jgi:hypothetical protein